jgi:hypothetical protein
MAGPRRVTPQLFQYNIKAACLNNPQRIVLPEVRRSVAAPLLVAHLRWALHVVGTFECTAQPWLPPLPPRSAPVTKRGNLPAMPHPPACLLPPCAQSEDKRVLAAAAEVTQRGLAKITLLGKPEVVKAEAKRLGLNISLCDIVDPKVPGGGQVQLRPAAA